ncbi:MAG: amidohydrolase family protein [Opitutales bacterium]
MALFQNASVPVACLPPDFPRPDGFDPQLDPSVRVDFRTDAERIREVFPAGRTGPAEGETAHDLAGTQCWPGLLDVHVHLDKAHSWDRAPNRRGEFWDAIYLLRRDKDNWTADDVRRRAQFSLESAWAHGSTAVRTHIDVGMDFGESSLAVMAELRAAWDGRISLQTVTLSGLEDFARGAGEAIAAKARAHGVTALGVMPITNPDLPGQWDRFLAIARDHGLGVDCHVDENGDPGARCLDALAESVLRTGFDLPVASGHNCSLAVQPPDRQRETLAKVRDAGIDIISLPLCNLYLQDRRRESTAGVQAGPDTEPDFDAPLGPPETPRWRGITLLHEFMEAGVTTAVASDNVRDAFYAYGDLDAFEVWLFTHRLAHLDLNLARSPETVTTAPARIMGLDTDHGVIGPGARADLIVFPGRRTLSHLLSRPWEPRRLIRGEGFREPELPDYDRVAPG